MSKTEKRETPKPNSDPKRPSHEPRSPQVPRIVRKVEMKIQPAQVCVDYGGHMFQHIVVTLRGDQQIDILRESPGAWTLVQAARTCAVKRGDTVTILSADGLVKVDSMTVTRAIGGEVWLAKPLRIVKLEPDILFEDAAHTVVPVGVGFSIKHNRGGAVEGKIFASVAAAKVALARRQPTQAA